MKDIDRITLKFKNIEKNAIKYLIEAQKESAKEICEDVKTLAPKKTGRYAESIKVGETEVTGDTIKTEIYTDAKVVSCSGAEYNLGYLLEIGTSPHLIEPVNAKVLHFQINGEDVFTKRVNHPGTIAQPHFSTGLNMNKLNYKMKMVEALRRSLDE